jgi:hypothetical protein
MIRKLIPVLLGLIGLGIGMGAGIFLRPAAVPAADTGGEHAAQPEEAAAPDAVAKADHAEEAPKEGSAEGGPEYVKLSNQFVIPVVEQGKVVSMVILALTLEVGAGTTEAIYAREPKLRDAFLQVLFDHANSGGFDGSFTDGANLVLLRKALLEAAQTAIGPNVSDVLISDIARQDS